ncbi:MAG: L-lactate permease, partial [Firmicutes bacterium]|nr:L-lactate permease [Bacillota bacterium]
LTVLIADWGLGPVKALLGVASIGIPFTPIDGRIVAGGQTLRVVFNWNLLEATGTAILLAAVLAAFVLRIESRRFLRVFLETLWSLRFALLTVASVLGFAFVANWSGMTPTLGRAFTVTGVLFPFMSAFLGWLGVFITGSDTSSNALFAKMQQITAENTGLNPVLTVATNSSGGVTGKMISPQNLAVGAAATGLVGREGDLFRFAVGHSLFFAALVGGMAMLQAYFLPGMVPPPVPAGAAVAETARGGADILFWSGIAILVLLLAVYRLAPVARPVGEVS